MCPDKTKLKRTKVKFSFSADIIRPLYSLVMRHIWYDKNVLKEELLLNVRLSKSNLKGTIDTVGNHLYNL